MKNSISQQAETETRDILAIYELNEISHREHFTGILRFFSGKPNWRLHLREPGEGFSAEDVKRRRYDGFIVSLPCGDQAMAALARSDIPTVLVNIDDRRFGTRDRNLSYVWVDNAGIGKCGARHLLKQGEFSSFGFVHDPNGQFYNREREWAFRDELKRREFRTEVCKPPSDGSAEPTLATWLGTLPKPAAIMSAGGRASHLLRAACNHLHLRIPQDIAIIGVDNDHTLLNGPHPTITSILPDFVKMGYLAAKELDKMIRRNGSRQFNEIVIPVKDIIPRDSTRISKSAKSLVETALAFIRERSDSPIRPKDVIQHLKCSRSLAELRFSEFHGKTIRETIEEFRVKRACAMLKKKHATVATVAKELGFRSANSLSRIFKRHCGRTIAHFRLQEDQR